MYERKCPSCDEGYINCSSCDAQGYIPCPNCIDGQVNCTRCNGTSQATCSSCGGMGTTFCGACRGSGGSYDHNNRWQNCYSCRGGRVSCYACNGTGKVHCGYCINGRVTCHVCGGGLSVTCKNCQGTGKVVCEKCNSTSILHTTSQVVSSYIAEENNLANTSLAEIYPFDLSLYPYALVEQAIIENKAVLQLLQKSIPIVEFSITSQDGEELSFFAHGKKISIKNEEKLVEKFASYETNKLIEVINGLNHFSKDFLIDAEKYLNEFFLVNWVSRVLEKKTNLTDEESKIRETWRIVQKKLSWYFFSKSLLRYILTLVVVTIVVVTVDIDTDKRLVFSGIGLAWSTLFLLFKNQVHRNWLSKKMTKTVDTSLVNEKWVSQFYLYAILSASIIWLLIKFLELMP